MKKRTNTLELTDKSSEIVHSPKHRWIGIRFCPVIARTKLLF